MQDMAWDDLRFVLAAMRFQTLAEAGRRLAVDEATVARRIARLERRLGARLFERVQGRFVPTDAGRLVAERAERIEYEVEAVMAGISGADHLVTGRVRVTSVPIVVNRILVPALPALLVDHPRLHLDLIGEPRDLSLMKRETDVAIRLARPNREMRMLARRIGYLDYAVYAAKGGDTGTFRWVTYDDMMADLPQAKWIAERIKAGTAEDPPIRVNDAEALVRLIEEGLGKSLLPTAIGDFLPGLIRVHEPSPPLRREVWLLSHPELRDLRRVRVVADWITSTIEALGQRDPDRAVDDPRPRRGGK
jgi:DNA-binding transcriptional LysR family regulator